MELSIREAAALLGKSPRTVRAWLARGDLAGRKRGGSWRIERGSLPLTERQREALLARGDELRAELERALPSRAATAHSRKRRSVADLDAFQRARSLLDRVRSSDPPVEAPIERALRHALLALCEGTHAFERERKLAAFRAARASLSRFVGLLLLQAQDERERQRLEWIEAVECDVLPALAGLLRWSEKLGARA